MPLYNPSSGAGLTADQEETLNRVGVLASRGAAADHLAGRYFATDEGIEYVSDGSTWTAITPGTQIAYAEITASPTDTTASSSATGPAVAGLAITPTLPAGPVKIEFWCEYAYNLTAARAIDIEIWDTTGVDVVIARISHWSSAAAEMDPVKIERVYTPGAGERSYEVRRWANTSGTAHINALATSPSFLSASRA